MGRRNVLAALVLLPIVGTQVVQADEVRYFEKDGVTYRETRRVVERPVNETHIERREQTVYREQYRTEVNESVRSVVTPVTEYQWTTVMRNRWNPFGRPYLAQELIPVQRWESRQEIVQRPVYRRELVPEVRTVEVPVTTQRLAQEEVITRVAVSGPAPAANVASAPATGNTLGGVARLENDPPRRSTSWRAAEGVTRY